MNNKWFTCMVMACVLLAGCAPSRNVLQVNGEAMKLTESDLDYQSSVMKYVSENNANHVVFIERASISRGQSFDDAKKAWLKNEGHNRRYDCKLQQQKLGETEYFVCQYGYLEATVIYTFLPKKSGTDMIVGAWVNKRRELKDEQIANIVPSLQKAMRAYLE